MRSFCFCSSSFFFSYSDVIGCKIAYLYKVSLKVDSLKEANLSFTLSVINLSFAISSRIILSAVEYISYNISFSFFSSSSISFAFSSLSILSCLACSANSIKLSLVCLMIPKRSFLSLFSSMILFSSALAYSLLE